MEVFILIYCIIGCIFFAFGEYIEYKEVKKEHSSWSKEQILEHMNNDTTCCDDKMGIGGRFSMMLCLWPLVLIFYIGLVIATLLSRMATYFIKDKK